MSDRGSSLAAPGLRVRQAVLLVLLCFIIGLPAYLIAARFPTSPGPDVVADWLVTRAAVAGEDPYANPEELARRYGLPYRVRLTAELDSTAVAHPRTPGALVAMTPLLLVPPSRLYPLAIAVTLVCVVLVMLLACRLAQLPAWVAAPLALLSLWTHAGILAIHHGTQSGVVAVLIAFAIWSTSRSDSVGGGVALGLATVLKVFPVLLILPLLLHRRFRAATSLIVSTAALTLAGFAFPGVHPAGAYEALRSASLNWITLSANGSFARVLAAAGAPLPIASIVGGVVVGLAAVVYVVSGKRRQLCPSDLGLGVLAVALLWPPLSWIHYDLALYPAAVVAGARSVRLDASIIIRQLAFALCVLSFAPIPGVDPGLYAAGRRAFLATMLLLAGRRDPRPPGSDAPATTQSPAAHAT